MQSVSEYMLVLALCLVVFCAFSALTLLVGRQEERPVCKKSELSGTGMVNCLEQGANDLHTTVGGHWELRSAALLKAVW